MKPRFSIVIPIYNAEGTLGETLSSLSLQTYQDLELILVNDGSTDRSADIIKDFSLKAKFPTQIISQVNQGLGASRNRGIAAAQGEWIVLLDADDLWAPEKLENLAACIDQTTSELIYHRVINFSNQGSKSRPSKTFSTVKELLTQSNPLVPSAVTLKRELGLQHPFSESRQLHGAEDIHLWVRLLEAGVNFGFCEEAVTYYRQEGGMSSDLENHLQYVFNALDDLKKMGVLSDALWAEARQRKYFEAGRHYQKLREFKKAQSYYKRGQQKSLKQKLIILANRLGIAF